MTIMKASSPGEFRVGRNPVQLTNHQEMLFEARSIVTAGGLTVSFLGNCGGRCVSFYIGKEHDDAADGAVQEHTGQVKEADKQGDFCGHTEQAVKQYIDPFADAHAAQGNGQEKDEVERGGGEQVDDKGEIVTERTKEYLAFHRTDELNGK